MRDHYLVLFLQFGYVYLFSSDIAFVFQGTMDDYLKLFLQFVSFRYCFCLYCLGYNE